MATLVDELPPANLPKAGCVDYHGNIDVVHTDILYFREHLKILVTHVEEGPGLFYAQICCDETIRSLQCLESMTDDISNVS